MRSPKAMEIYKPRTARRLLLVLFILMLRIASCFADQESANTAPERPSFGNFVQETLALWKKSHQTSWEKVKSLLHHMQLQFFPPNLDFRSRDEGKGSMGVVDEMKEAVEKSFGASKEAVEESAKSAAEAVHKTADKVKENLADKDKEQPSHDEL